jgi:serine protease 27
LIFPALLRLKKPIKFNRNIQPLCLSTNAATSETGIVTGWGWTNEDLSIGEKPNVLQTVDVPVWQNEECQKSYKDLMKTNKISESQMCAGGRDGGVDSCWADSGGPLISKTTGNLIGIVSTGVGCARRGLPGIYTRVSRFANWIEKNVK